ncbi:hypothetical protein ACWEH1_30670, partial [Micromonospora chersina]
LTHVRILLMKYTMLNSQKNQSLKQTHQTKNILVLHSSHLSGDQIKKSYRFALNQSKNVYKYIVLTHQQKHDIQQHFHISDDQFQLVPHFIELDTEVEQDSSNNQNRFIYIGRFSTEKQIDHIIRAYHKFLQSGYQTELHLFGRDEDNQIPLMPTIRRPFSVLVAVPVAAMLIPHVPDCAVRIRSHLLDRLERSCARYQLFANRHAMQCQLPDRVILLTGQSAPPGWIMRGGPPGRPVGCLA